VTLGESVFAHRTLPNYKALIPHLDVVAEASSVFGKQQAAGAEALRKSASELDALQSSIAQEEAKLVPLRAQENTWLAKLAPFEERVARLNAAVTKLDAEIQSLRAKRAMAPGDTERLAALSAEREARHAESQSLGIQLMPQQDELASVRRSISKHVANVAALAGEQRLLAAETQRTQQRNMVSTGGAKSAQRDALKSLAQAAMQQRLLTGNAQSQAEEANTLRERAKEKLAKEELHRAATNSYDAKAYELGIRTMFGVVFGMFALLALLIFL
jgi:hypothetical protein